MFSSNSVAICTDLCKKKELADNNKLYFAVKIAHNSDQCKMDLIGYQVVVL